MEKSAALYFYEKGALNEKYVKENLENPGLESHDRDAEAGYSAEAR